MRIRIALSTAVAVLVVPSVLFMSLSSNPAGAVRDRYQTGTHHRAGHHAGTLRGAGHHVGTRHRAVSHHESTRHREARIQSRATSLSKAKKSAELTSFDNAVKEALFVQAVNKAVFDQAVKKAQVEAYLKALAAQQAAQQAAAAQAAAAAANSFSAIPAAWVATAICEEGGRNDSNYGFFGIKVWNGFDGYRTAGSAPLSVQLAWESAHGISPPDAPGRCHAY